MIGGNYEGLSIKNIRNKLGINNENTTNTKVEDNITIAEVEKIIPPQPITNIKNENIEGISIEN
jgi:hypothetical protein